MTFNISDTQHNNTPLSSIVCHYDECRVFYCYAECHYAEYRYAECRYAQCRGATVTNVQLTDLLRYRINYDHKKFYDTGPRLEKSSVEYRGSYL
jgi:hypothetical protein